MNITDTLQFVASVLGRFTSVQDVSIIGDRMVWVQNGSRWASVEPITQIGHQGESIGYKITRGLEAGVADPADESDDDVVTVSGFMFGGGVPAVTSWIK